MMRFRFCLFCLPALLTTAPITLRADDFYLTPKTEQAPEMGELLSYSLTVGTAVFSFVPPHDWRVGAQPESHRVVLQAPDAAASISIVFGQRDGTMHSESDPELLRKKIADRFSQVRIVEEFPTYTSSHKGQGFQVQWIVAGQVSMISRVAFFSSRSEVFEVTLTTAASRFQQFQAALGTVLTSFQETHGALVAQQQAR
jgi:hypothetical protein